MAQSRIVAGPSKFDLMLALFDNSNASKRHVQFTLQVEGGSNEVKTQSFTGPNAVSNMLAAMDKLPTVVETDITSVEREDGSGESWNIEGYINTPKGYRRFKAYFDTRSRKGTLTLDE
jgi:hypothetical protein